MRPPPDHLLKRFLSPPSTGSQNDDEWLDYESEKKDYSGLKIESLKVGDKDGGEDEEEQEHEINEETGEKIPVAKKDGNVWSRSGGGQHPRAESPDARSGDEDARSTTSSSNENNTSGNSGNNESGGAAAATAAAAAPKSSYVPPHLRGVNR